MSPNKLAAFRLSEELLATLAAIKVRDGIPVTEQVRRALEAWVTDRAIRPASTKTRRTRKGARS